jgi:hypothetical protein
MQPQHPQSSSRPTRSTVRLNAVISSCTSICFASSPRGSSRYLYYQRSNVLLIQKLRSRPCSSDSQTSARFFYQSANAPVLETKVITRSCGRASSSPSSSSEHSFVCSSFSGSSWQRHSLALIVIGMIGKTVQQHVRLLYANLSCWCW